MSRNFLILTIIIILIASAVSAKVNFTIEPDFSVLSGKTEYEMDIIYNYINDTISPPTNVTWHLRSLLEFPLDTKIGGIRVQVTPDIDKTRWAVAGKYFTKLNDPGDKMKDSDWQGESPLYDYTHFSYTESDSKLKMNTFELETNYRILHRVKFNLSILAGGRYQKLEYDLIGLEGWQKRFDPNIYAYEDTSVTISASVYAGVNVGYYEVTYKQMLIGLKGDWYLNERVTGIIRAGVTPTKFEDLDNHLLRFKESVADGDGMGYFGSASIRYELNRNEYGKTFFVQTTGSFLTLDLSGNQTQRWYDDEYRYNPDTQQYEIAVPKGTVISGLPHKVRSNQYKIGLQVGYTF